MIENFDFGQYLKTDRSAVLSLVVPVLNEEAAIPGFVKAVDAEIAANRPDGKRPLRLEFVFVDDGSTDRTVAVVRELCRSDDRIRLVRLSRNFGKEAALSAGMAEATGDAVIPMDVDLQDPPHIIHAMVAKWEEGAEVVNARRVDRSEDSMFKRGSAKVFYRMLNLVSEHPVAENVGDFRLLDRRAVSVLNQMTERSRFNKGLFSWIGFQTETVEYARPAREVGETKWRAGKLATLALDGIISSTTLPLRVWTLVGAVIALMAFAYGSFLIVHTLLLGVDTPGYASLMVAVLFLGGLNLVSLGILGEYVGRIAVQVRNRPLYVISSKEGF